MAKAKAVLRKELNLLNTQIFNIELLFLSNIKHQIIKSK